MPDTATRATEIRAELDKLAPYPDGEAVTARSLARWMAMEAQLAWARMTGMDHPITMTDIAILQGNFAAAHALLAFAEDDGRPFGADEAAVQVREAFDPPGIGEWLYEHLGDDAEKVAALAEDLARATAGDSRVEVSAADLRAALTSSGILPDDVYDRLTAAAGGEPATSDHADEVARLKAELSRAQSAAQTLGKVVTRMAESMEAARIEMIQNGPELAMQWILNSLPDVSDEAPGDQWDGKETATEWIDRTQAADRASAGDPR